MWLRCVLGKLEEFYGMLEMSSHCGACFLGRSCLNVGQDVRVVSVGGLHDLLERKRECELIERMINRPAKSREEEAKNGVAGRLY